MTSRFALSLLFCGSLLAGGVTPPASGARTVQYGDKDVVRINARLRFTTLIVLPKNEQILDFVCGDKEFWVVNGNQNFAYVKPAKERARTDLNLITASGNVYSFVLEEVSAQPDTEADFKVFVELRDEAMVSALAAPPRFVTAQAVEDYRQQMEMAKAETREAKEAAQKAIERESAKFREEYPTNALKFPYRFQANAAPFHVTAIYHDDKFTYIQASPQETPALYEIKDGKPNLIDFEFKNGAYVVPKILESGYAAVAIDEAALIPNLEAAWQESIRPMLSDYRGGAWFLSTPKGVSNYFHTLYQRGQDPNQTDWASWQMPTGANPHIDAAEIESARGDLTDLAFAQEYLAQFVSWEGAVFRRILDAVAEPPEGVPACAIGADWAGSGRGGDYTVFVGVSTAGQVLALDRFRGAEYGLQRARLQGFWERHGARSWIFAEMNSMGGPLVEQLRKDGLPVCGFQTTNVSKADAILKLALAFERGEIKIPNDPVLIGELQAFEGRPLPSGLMRYAAPEGGHDDCVMSLAIAWQGLGLWQQQRAQREAYIEVPPMLQISAI